ncbi:uncharacterized protein PgNI_11945 [Pyricularia grisea]|uniref:Uncharacterized protein n=1 Tax=Pyricularia grisea TaxID=148305 RepID=A0A6P8AR48_PYRGI|nr:uncharacterized protein PgNI_11945 [Pyricularia grisea]TLD04529.1 hypothetical protein PgNI_11945 [Pyricularia grisea]
MVRQFQKPDESLSSPQPGPPHGSAGEVQGQDTAIPYLAQGQWQGQGNPAQTSPTGTTSLVLGPPVLPIAPTVPPLEPSLPPPPPLWTAPPVSGTSQSAGPVPESSIAARSAKMRRRALRAVQTGRRRSVAVNAEPSGPPVDQFAAPVGQPGPARGRPSRGRLPRERSARGGKPAPPPPPLFSSTTQDANAPVQATTSATVPAPTLPVPPASSIPTVNPIFPGPNSVVSNPWDSSPSLQAYRLFSLAEKSRYVSEPAVAHQTLDQAVRQFVMLFPADIDINDILTDEVMGVLTLQFGRPRLSHDSGRDGNDNLFLPQIRDTVMLQVRENRLAHWHELERRARPDTYTPYRLCSCRVLPLPCWCCGYGNSR